jgi:hypothetical protein
MIITTKKPQVNFISISKYEPFNVSLNDIVQKNNYYISFEEDNINIEYIYRVLKSRFENKKVVIDNKGYNIIQMDTRGIYFIQKIKDLYNVDIYYKN